MVTMVFFEVLDLCFFFKPTKPTGGAPPCSDDRKSFKSSFWRKYREVLRKHLYAFGKLNKWHVYLVLQSQHFHSYLSAKMTVSGWLNLDQQPCTVCIYIYTNNTAYYAMVIWHMVMNGDQCWWSYGQSTKASNASFIYIYIYIYTHISTHKYYCWNIPVISFFPLTKQVLVDHALVRLGISDCQ